MECKWYQVKQCPVENVPLTEGRFSCADPEFFQGVGGVGRGSKGYFRFASGGDGVGVAECAGGVFHFCIYSIIKYRTIDVNNVYKLDNNYIMQSVFHLRFHRIFQMHLIIMQKYAKVMTTSLEYHMPWVLCTCVLIGHILSSEISIIILSSEIFEIHFDDTIILLYSTTTYFI